MNTKNLASLEERINDWIQELAEFENNEYTGYYHDELHTQMAKAAEQVFDSCFLAQKFVEEQT